MYSRLGPTGTISLRDPVTGDVTLKVLSDNPNFNGLKITYHPADQSVTTYWPNGDWTTKKHDGTCILYTAHNGNTQTEKDGHWYMTFPKKPDGSVSIYYENGITITKYPNGHSVIH
jgi:hypothetical protein